MITVYGIKNCDTVKKTLKWLTEHKVEYRLHDYRTDGVEKDFLVRAQEAFGWQALVNKRSTSWRNLDEQIKKNLSKQTALQALLDRPTLIKRPIILQDGIALIGFDIEAYGKAFQ